MQVRKNCQYRLYTNDKNKHLHRLINVASVIWNHCIALHKRYYRLTGKYLNQKRLKAHIAKLRNGQRYAFWQQVGSQAVQDIIERIERGYQRFFKYRKQRRIGPPSLRKRNKYKSFTLKQAGWQLLEGNQIRIGKHIYKYVKSREIKGCIKTVTVKRDALGRLWLFFSVIEEIEVKDKTSTGKSGGFDFGLKSFLTDDEGKHYMHPQYFKAELNRIRSLNRSVSRKTKASSHYRQAVHQLAKAHDRIANKRHEFHFALACQLCQEYSTIYLEDLNIEHRWHEAAVGSQG